jgi:hypothetical protein
MDYPEYHSSNSAGRLQLQSVGTPTTTRKQLSNNRGLICHISLKKIKVIVKIQVISTFDSPIIDLGALFFAESDNQVL